MNYITKKRMEVYSLYINKIKVATILKKSKIQLLNHV